MKSLNLNENQHLAVIHKNGPMMVLAGPGSGKTTVITHRVQYLINNHGVDSREILVITYTKAAAEEMKKRYENMIGRQSPVVFSTFHSLFFKILRAHTSLELKDVLKDDERRDVIRGIVLEMNIEIDDEDEFLQSIMSEMSLIKNELIDINFYNSMSLASGDFRTIVNIYEEYKQSFNKLDFDDMISRCYNILIDNDKILSIWQNRFKYLMIDEFQDINKAQYSIVNLLVRPLQNIYIVGDDDQSIYRFRGARPDFLLNFSKDFKGTQTTILDINYRSTDEIIALSNKIIKENLFRYNKNIKGTDKKGANPVLLNSANINAEAINIANKIKNIVKNVDINEICVVYRTNIQSRSFIDAFTNLNIAYKVKDEVPSVYEHFIFKDISAYMNASTDRNDNISLERILNKPKRYINKGIVASVRNRGASLITSLFESPQLKIWQLKRIEELEFYLNSISKRNPYDAFKYIRKAVGYDDYIKEYASFKKVNPKGLFEVMDELQESSKNFETLKEYVDHAEAIVQNSKNITKNKNVNGVTLSTMHGVKGLEFDVVFISSCVEGVIPHEKSRTDSEIEEERRLFYVAMTRPKEVLYLSTVQTRYEEEVELTRFLSGVVSTV